MEQLVKDPTKRYLTQEPFFLEDGLTGAVHILRGSNVDIWGNTIKESK